MTRPPLSRPAIESCGTDSHEGSNSSASSTPPRQVPRLNLIDREPMTCGRIGFLKLRASSFAIAWEIFRLSSSFGCPGHGGVFRTPNASAVPMSVRMHARRNWGESAHRVSLCGTRFKQRIVRITVEDGDRVACGAPIAEFSETSPMWNVGCVVVNQTDADRLRSFQSRQPHRQ